MNYIDLYHANKSADGIFLCLDAGVLTADLSNVYDGFFSKTDADTLKPYLKKGMSLYSCSIQEAKIIKARNMHKTPENMTVLRSLCNVRDNNILDMFADFIFGSGSNMIELEDLLPYVPTKADSIREASRGSRLNFLKYEVIRLKGRIAAKLGYDAIQIPINGHSHILIVNPNVPWRKLESANEALIAA
ncbi:hypothetical protein LMH73_017810 [Vibrio splendidus]|nr:hypothetical protein [Vibrio splendidus]MCC4881539.1 hypothetical protein [Vibrio splendidus]